MQDIDGFDEYNVRDTNWHNTIEKNYYLSNMQGAPRFINVIKNNILDYSLEPTSEIFETLKNSNLISSGAKNNSKISIKSRLKISLPNETIQTMLRLNFTKIKVKYKRAHASDNDYRTYEIPLNENTLSDNELHLIEEYNSNPDTSAIGITTVSGRFTHTDRGINYMANEYFIKITSLKGCFYFFEW
ncbi:Uncharacterised protein [Mycoplasmopsis maculosa]|uniref:Uncharacterized protein n=1 Tax=Mycoplasmopsis maculosa TaxID=114885 RepID=A0A449B4V6_9BACT|nr:hypothetical protein [Mycoplasmopsis maculosa]VEU75605.1 Uncharacterised protein [Mycoplasmopsis maculosa]